MLQRLLVRLKQMVGLEPKFLCDHCAYDHGNVCNRRERPNARYCPEYRRR